MEFREAQTLVLLAQLGAIRRVADAIHLSPPSVHTHLKTLEAEFGVQLYQRVGRRLRLTEAAETLLPYLQGVLAEREDAVRALDEWKGLRQGVVRIGAGPSVGAYFVPQLLKQFFARYPGIAATIHTGPAENLIERLGAGDLDLAFLVISDMCEYTLRGLNSFRVMPDVEFDLISSYSGGRQVTRSLADFTGTPFILYDKDSRLDILMEHYFEKHAFQPRVILRCDTSETIRAAVKKGIGIAMVPLWAVEEDVRHRSVRIIPLREGPFFLKVLLAFPKRRYTPPAVRAILDLVQQTAPHQPLRN